MAAIVVPPGLVTASRSWTGCSPVVAQHGGRTDRGLHDQLGRQRPGQPQQDAGVDHRLDQEEEVGRARSGQRGDGVQLRLGHPHDLADARHQRLGQGQVRSAACAPAEMAVIASSTRAGVLGMQRTTAVPGGSAASMRAVGTPAATETTTWSGRR